MAGTPREGAAATPPPPDADGRQRTTTLRRSCEACRAVKARCVVEPPNGTPGQTRCLSHGIECHFENALARPKKLKYTARTRVKDVEEKLDGLIALISSRREGSSSAAVAASAVASLSGSAVAGPSEQTTAATSTPNNSYFYSQPLNNLPPITYPAPIGFDLNFDEMPYLDNSGAPIAMHSSHSLTASYGDVIDRGLVQEELASVLLDEFTTYSEKQFPFVAMPSYASLSYMRRDRPYVLLAVLTVTADTSLQARLALEYRKALSQAMLVESRNSLDLLQSVLIFCIWHHHYFRPYSSQLYQLSQIAVTMAVEINLPSSMSPTLNSLMAPHHQALGQRPRSSRTPTEQMANEIERARTFLGTYCVSASIATAHRKPTHFKYDRRMDQAVQFLTNAREIPSDTHLLPYHVQIRKISEDVDRVFGSLDQGGITLDARYIEAMVKDFERQYEALRNSMTTQSWDNAALKCAMMYLPVVIYEVALRIPPEHQALLEVTPNAQCCNWCCSSIRLEILMKCVAAAQAYIRSYLDLSEDDSRHVTIVEVSRHVDAVLILTRAGLGFDTKNFQQGVMALGRADLLKAADVARYLEASKRKMASLVTMTDAMTSGSGSSGTGQVEKQDLFWQMKHIFQLSLDWYNKHVNSETGTPQQISQVEAHENAKLDVSPIFWISEGTTMVREKCATGVDKAMEGIPHFAANSVYSMIQALSSCVENAPVAPTAIGTEQPGAAGAIGSMTGPPVSAALHPSAVSGHSVSPDPMNTSTPASSSGYVPPLDPRLAGSVAATNEAIPPWSADQSAELFSNIPQSSTNSPWFTL
ncbi:uncharacterized protein SPSK_07010 [Sporothrix schenckii 1099-18]|nr:uncharacterized protein SPSK_07010 [Sporothrix schenckii 1099-18]KJR87925.1 hypothetical protein SPSK_07010 [Sporothrix schenckii 1099-18]